jgi:hypothetical protein
MSRETCLQKDYQKEAKKAFRGGVISDFSVVKNYLERLLSPLKQKINGQKETTHFIMDYLQGEGDELGGKFFSPFSSSRLCFDIYSWLALPTYEKEGYTVAFEKFLPRLKLGRENPYPNMDVMIVHGDTLLFIESKFTETVSYPGGNKESENDFCLPLSYSSGLAENLQDKEREVLIDRYYGNEEAALRFRSFILDINDAAKKNSQVNDWFDPKQECTHLFGILFYLLGVDPVRSLESDFGKEIRHVLFYNIVYSFDDKMSPVANRFVSEGNLLIKDLLKENRSDLSFEYGITTVQHYYQSVIVPKNPIAFGDDQQTSLRTYLADPKHYIELSLEKQQKDEFQMGDSLVKFFQ